ncbi:MAG: hypothetical protein KHX99_01825, partial [Atopobium sp.]|nr:hypothetical protein [Atopobium sp.]
MADNKLSVRRVEGVVDGTVAATLSQLLRLTSDAVIVFNMEGMVLLANEEAESLFVKEDGTIAGLDVRFLFTPANQENLQKPFSVGVRIEHPQDLIDIAQYGAPGRELGLPPADYKLSWRCENGRGVYTFCMCPGGFIVPAM